MHTKKLSLVSQAQQLISSVITQGDSVIDATMGNGQDTLFLANTVGPQGKVYGFDIQTTAVARTRALLDQHGCLNSTLIHQCHSKISEALALEGIVAPISAAMFNLGYLPSSDKKIVTKTNTTLTALDSILPLLAKQACITILAYRGHPGGASEAEAISQYCKTLNSHLYYSSIYLGNHSLAKTLPENNNISTNDHANSLSTNSIKNMPPILYTIRKIHSNE